MNETKSLYERMAATAEGARLLKQEQAILEVTEFICSQMEAMSISRAELAKRLGKTKGYITQLLDGRANMTIRTVADVCHALGCEFHVSSGSNGRAVLAKGRAHGKSDSLTRAV